MNAFQTTWLAEIGLTAYELKPLVSDVLTARIVFREAGLPWIIAEADDPKCAQLLEAILAALKHSMETVNLFYIGNRGEQHGRTEWRQRLMTYAPQHLVLFGQQASGLFFKGQVLEKMSSVQQLGMQKIVLCPALQHLLLYPSLKRQVWHDLTKSFSL